LDIISVAGDADWSVFKSEKRAEMTQKEQMEKLFVWYQIGMAVANIII